MKSVAFKKLKISNFLSIGEDSIEIFPKRGLNIITGENLDVVGRQNGVGKSTIADAFYFTLFGETIREIKNTSIINKFTNKTCECVLEFSVDENGTSKDYKIVRTLKPSKLYLFEGETDITQSTIAETETTISKILNSSKEVFQNSVIMSLNGTTPFMATKKVEKRKFVEGILDISIFSEMLKDVRAEYNELSKDHDADKVRKEEISKNVSFVEEQKISAIERQKKEIESIENSIKECDENISKISKDLESMQSNLKDVSLLESKKKEISKEIQELNDEKISLKEDVLKLKSALEKIAENQSTKNRYEKELEQFKDSLEKQKKLYKEVSDENFDEILNKLKEERETYETKIKNLDDKISNVKSDVQDGELDVKEICRELKRLEENKGACEWCKKSIDDILKPINEKKISELKEKLKSAEVVVGDGRDAIKLLNQKKIESSDILSKIKQDIGEKEEDKLENDSAKKSNNLVDEKIKSIQESIQEKEGLLKELKDFSDKKSKIIENIEEIQKNISDISSKVSSKEERISDIQDEISNTKIAENNIKNLKESIKNFETSKKTWNSKLEEQKNQNSSLKELETKLEELTESLTKICSRIDRNEILLEVMGNAKFILSEEGVKSYIVKKILNILNSKISYYLAKMDAPCKISFNEYFEDTICDLKGREAEYWNFSGAERKAIDLAIMFAFIDLMRLNGNASFNTLFFDELLDSSMDSKGIDNVINILNDRVENYGDCIYIISHRKESIKHMTGELILLQKKNGITKLKE